MFNESTRRTKRGMVAAAIAHHGEIRDAKKVANNTLRYVRVSDGAVIFRLHATDILTRFPGGTALVDTGGFNTITTRQRLNRFGVRCRSSGGTLYVFGVPVKRYCRIDPDGTVTPDVAASRLLTDRQALNRCMAAWRKRGLPTVAESGGDPWVFSLDQVTGEAARDWIESAYVARRIAALALEATGLSPYGVTLTLHNIDRAGGRVDKCTLRRVRRFLRTRAARD